MFVNTKELCNACLATVMREVSTQSVGPSVGIGGVVSQQMGGAPSSHSARDFETCWSGGTRGPSSYSRGFSRDL